MNFILIISISKAMKRKSGKPNAEYLEDEEEGKGKKREHKFRAGIFFALENRNST